MSPADWFEHKSGVPSIRAAWAALAAASGGDIDVSPLPSGPGVPLRSSRASPDTLAALPAPRVLPGGWWIGSFSAIAHGARHDRSGVDHDLRVVDNAAAAGEPLRADLEPARSPFRATEDDALNFPRGPAAGECIHQAFETIDFTEPAGWSGAIAAALRMLHTMGVDTASGAAADLPANAAAAAPAPGDRDALHGRMLGRLLADVLNTPLALGTPNPLRLARLPASRRLVELEFHLPSHRLDPTALNDVLASNGYSMPRLSFTALRGFLKGFIDLVFEHDGRYFVLDWKSNHLGDAPAHYAQGTMAAAMRDQGYHLQYLLYTVALDRYLRHRLAGYRPEQHLGGVVYLFVRGVRPDWTDAAGAQTGVYFHRPAPDTIRQLSTLFDDVGAAA
jgi:exodeoxyribonuclease V beta subunit